MIVVDVNKWIVRQKKGDERRYQREQRKRLFIDAFNEEKEEKTAASIPKALDILFCSVLFEEKEEKGKEKYDELEQLAIHRISFFSSTSW